MELLLLIFFTVVACLWLVLGVEMIRGMLVMRRLPRLDEVPALARRPVVSVIIAVRDEAGRIGQTVRQLAAQEGVEVEVIVVDDRSTDGTGEVIEGLRGEVSNLKVIHVERLPEMWLGKCHAMHLGSRAARGEWLLFTDGDIWMAPDAVVRAVATAEALGADHLTMTPTQTFPRPPSAAFRACMLVFMVLFNLEMSRANRDRRNAIAGVGAFNMVRRTTYDAFGGHEALRLEVGDDVKTGLLVGRVGGRSRVFLGHELVEADWAWTVRGIVKALEKNAFVGMSYSVRRLVLITVMFVAMWGGAWVGAFTGTWAGVAASCSMALFVVAAGIQARKIDWPVWPALLTPVAMLIMPVTFWHSALTTLRQGGVRWRDTFYPLALLRKHVVRTEKSGPFSV